ncbi:hypothetical protein OMR07_15840 [Methylobacterium organophilum]|nr:hypothetical protein [Methylobacterium organophilum]
MVDLTSEMAGLWATLGPAPAHRARVIQFASAVTGEGVSTVAREFARLAAVRARKPVWLIDGDLAQQGQLETVSAEPDRFGQVGKAAQGSPDGSSFYAVTPRVTGRDGKPVPDSRFPCLQLARQSAENGGTAPAMLNAANEVAVEAFLNRRIRFTEIASIIDDVLNREAPVAVGCLEDVLAADRCARERAGQWLDRNGR